MWKRGPVAESGEAAGEEFHQFLASFGGREVGGVEVGSHGNLRVDDSSDLRSAASRLTTRE